MPAKPPNYICSQKRPILPDRCRRIDEDGFAFIPNRFFRDGFFSSLAADETRLYLFLVLVGDRSGLSHYSYDRICSTLEVTLERYIELRNALIEKDLIAFDGYRFQVLSLPERPRFCPRPALQTPGDLDERDPATIRQRILDALEP